MKKSLLFTIIIVVVAIIGFIVWYTCFRQENPIDLDNYVPNEDFKSAFEALENAKKQDKEKTYDLEETIRIINGLEVAQSQSEDFYSYLEYMARQDYSRVPDEILQAKERLLPILQKMNDLQKQYDELSDIWSLVQNAANQGTTTLMEDLNPIATISSIFAGDAIGTIDVSQSLSKAKTAMFEKYAEDQKLKSSLKEQIDELRMAYIDYLGQYAPVYMKYMKEWDKLCLSKDKAYLDLYAGRYSDAYNATQKVLNDYPNNREALLLKALSLLQMANDAGKYPEFIKEENMPEVVNDSTNMPLPSDVEDPEQDMKLAFCTEADEILDVYIGLYPSRTAPALILKGLLNLQSGNETQAMSFFDQASMEYPRQAQALTDLLDSYRCRTYLNKSPEGKYLLELYRSTMEGYGMFSPNLLKAKYYSLKGDFQKSKEEIFNHFYRRGNQGVYDCLLSDMQYCEENMYDTFRQLLLEQSFIDVAVEPTSNWYLSDKDDEAKVIINNRSDIDLENVRLFLCIHYTDMYTDEYDVVKVPSINIIPHHDKTEVGTVSLTYPEKTYNDITRIRAIAMTDDKICWIDEVKYKLAKAADKGKSKDKDSKTSLPESFLKHFNIDQQTLLDAVKNGLKVTSKQAGSDILDQAKKVLGVEDETIDICLPRILSILDPVFSINPINDTEKALQPTDNYLSGSDIHVKFKYHTTPGEDIPLYVYTSFISLKVTIHIDGTTPKIQNIEII